MPTTENTARKRAAKKKAPEKDKSLESWIWDAACSIRGAKDAPKYKDYILPLIFTKRLCDVFDDELNRIAAEVGSRKKAFQLAKADHKLVRFYLPLVPDDPEQPVWSVIRKRVERLGEGVTTHMRAIALENPLLQGIIDRVDFNATTHGQRDLDDDRLSNLIEAVSTKRLGLDDVEADIIGKSYEYLIRKFAEGGGQSAGEFYTPPEVGTIMSRVLQPEPGMEIYDPTCGSGGLLVKCEVAMERGFSNPRSSGKGGQECPPSNVPAPLKLYGQEFTPETWAMANMNMIIHDMEGQIEIGDTFKNPKFRDKSGRLRRFDRVIANPMWNQDWFTEADYDNDELDRFPAGAGFPGKSSADWGWVQHMHASLNATGLDRHRLREQDGYLELVLPGPGEDLGRLKIPPSKLGAILPQKLTAQLNERQQKMAELLASGVTLTSRFCEEEFGVSRQTSSADFALLIKLEIAARIGSGRSTAYAFHDGK